MALSVHLDLTINGKKVEGESTQKTLGRDKTIECVAYEQQVNTAREDGTNTLTGLRQYRPIKIVKRIDKSSPLLMKALTKNEKVEGKFRFYRPNPAQDGTTQHYFTVELGDANIAGVKQYIPETVNKDSVGSAPMEEIEFVFKKIVWTYEDGGVSHPDQW